MGLTAKTDVAFDKTLIIQKALKAMVEKGVLVGVPAGSDRRKKKKKNAKTPIPNAALGYIHEYGSAANNIPPRPFLVPGVNDSIPKVEKVLKKGAEEILEGRGNIERTLGTAGAVAASSVKRRITQSIDMEPLKPATIARRKKKTKGKPSNSKFANEDGSANEKPLLDTGQLRTSITYVVDKV